MTANQAVPVRQVDGLDDGADRVAGLEVSPDQLDQSEVRVVAWLREVPDVGQLHSSVGVVLAEESLELVQSGVLVRSDHHHHHPGLD